MKGKLRLKKNPFKIGYGKAPRPAIRNALNLFPPAPKPTRSVDPLECGQFIPKVEPKYYYKTSEIIYEEDEIRTLFYKQHPFELYRPRDLNDLNAIDIVWDNIYSNKKIPLCGESVVQYTIYLRKSGKPLEDCYKQALLEFYRARENEERIENQARSLAIKVAKELESEKLEKDESYKVDPLAGLVWAKAFMKHERVQLHDSKEYKREKNVSE
jgi:small subunit ribosomal protein S23